MGCPSLTLSREKNLGQILSRKFDSVLRNVKAGKRLKIAITEPAYVGDDYSKLWQTFFELFKDHDVTFIEQSQYDKANIERYGTRNGITFVKKGENTNNNNDNGWPVKKTNTNSNGKKQGKNKKSSNSNKKKSVRRRADERKDNDMNATFVMGTNNRFFYKIDPWMDFLKTQDLVLGARIHGAMIGLAASVPSVAIPTDMRIFELADIMKIPRVQVHDPTLTGEFDLAKFLEASIASFDGKVFDENRMAMIRKYKIMLNAIGVEIDPVLDLMSQAEE
jgi:hypothetical protein